MNDDDLIERIGETLREPVRLDPLFDQTLMKRIRQEPVPTAQPSMWFSLFDWLRRRRTIQVSPLGALGFASVAVLVVVGLSRIPLRQSTSDMGAETLPSAVIQFVFVAPGAQTVSLVGDFNDWNVTSTPLDMSNGMWTVSLPLGPGRYRYAFLIDGARWASDPRGVKVLEDEFGRPNSVVTIGGA